jgi:hypothetical protein
LPLMAIIGKTIINKILKCCTMKDLNWELYVHFLQCLILLKSRLGVVLGVGGGTQ